MVKNLSRLCWKMQVLTRGFYCIVFFKSFLKRPVILDAVWGFPELHDLVKKEESIVELLYTTSRRGGGGVFVHSKLKRLYREAPPRCLTPYPLLYSILIGKVPLAVYCNVYWQMVPVSQSSYFRTLQPLQMHCWPLNMNKSQKQNVS